MHIINSLSPFSFLIYDIETGGYVFSFGENNEACDSFPFSLYFPLMAEGLKRREI